MTAPSDPRSRESAWWLLAAAVVVLGWLLRTDEFLARPALWVDEARLALNLASRSWLELLQPLDHDQSAPLAFLWLARGSVRLLGYGEIGLRAVPFAAGLTLLPALWLLGRRLLGPRGALIAVALAAVSPSLIRYSNEVKQYQTDALATAAALGLYLLVAERRTRRPGLWLALGGCVLLLVAHPAPFVLAGLGLALLLEARRTPALARPVVRAGLAWCLAFAVLYLVWYRPVGFSAYMRTFWEPTFLDLGASDARARLWWGGKMILTSALPGPTGLLDLRIFAALFLWGTWSIGRRAGWANAVLVAAPLATVSVASFLALYPLAERMVLFLAPCVLIAFGAAVGDLAQRSGPLQNALVGVVAGGLLILGIREHWETRSGHAGVNTRTMIAQIRGADAVPVYVMAGAIPAWTYYSSDWPRYDRERLARIARLAGAAGDLFENAAPRGHPVRCEGLRLGEEVWGRSVVFGIPVGTGARERLGWTQPDPDPGWAENEARRIRGTAAPRIWVLAAHYETRWLEELFSASLAAGAHIQSSATDDGDEEGASLTLVDFTSPAPTRVEGVECPP